ncbi:hypothetical protein JDV02_008250 [Purpureocillium takamizusanense]|uniref:Uncharacterized protein n=1 Tax=Purpureocillium takamizusanense TaxID=2060973 RepID=A0A9Q8VEX4_9HYPO|nr:uncharacterized protein JDV02_008250 [Purpureocillium takamizusanense]UNI22354.1 hypothetical protein JDV02_008250 [Purpureocillium takamizusanense]
MAFISHVPPRRAVARFTSTVPEEVRDAWRIAKPGIKDILNETADIRNNWSHLILDARGADHRHRRSKRDVCIYITQELSETAWIDVTDQIHDYLETFEVGFEVRVRYVED